MSDATRPARGEQLDAALSELGRVASAAGSAIVPSTLDELLRCIAETARTLLGAQGCSIALLEGEQLVFEIVAGAAEKTVTGMRVAADRGIAGWAISSGQSIAVQDVSRDPRFAADVAEAVGYTPTSILAMPLETDRETLGVIEVLDPGSAGTSAANDMELLAAFARQAALAIETQRAFSSLGRVMLDAIAAGSGETELTESLGRIAEDRADGDAHLAELAGMFARLGRLGSNERAAAVRMVHEFLTYVQESKSR